MKARPCYRIALGAVTASLILGCTGDATGPDPTAPFGSVTVGVVHSCALTTAGEAYCWGWGEHGQLGNGSTSDADVPAAVRGDHTFSTVSAGGGHTCAITSSGETYCWGLNESGQLGNGTLDGSREPLPAGSPLWEMENVILTPHIAGVSPKYLARAKDIIGHNLQVYVSDTGEMMNVVDLTEGY